MKIEDSRVRSGIRVFKATVDGAKKKAVLAGFGEVDMRGGAVTFSIDSSGHSSIESGEAEHEQFSLEMEQPLVAVWAVSSDGLTYNVYVEKGSGLWEEPTHGIIGEERRCVGVGHYEAAEVHPPLSYYILFYAREPEARPLGWLAL